MEWSEVLSSGRLNAVDESIKLTSRLINRTIPKITKIVIGSKIQSKPVVPIKDQRMDAQNACSEDFSKESSLGRAAVAIMEAISEPT